MMYTLIAYTHDLYDFSSIGLLFSPFELYLKPKVGAYAKRVF